MQKLLLTLCLIGGLFTVLAGQKKITLEDIWQTYEFIPESVSGFNYLADGKSYTRLEDNKVYSYDLESGKRTTTVLDGGALGKVKGYNGKIDSYEFSDDESKILISSDTRQLYRHSTEAYYFVYDREAKTLKPVNSTQRHRLASLDPSGTKVAYVADNDLYFKNLLNDQVTQVTKDGKVNEIINGATDWVYEEEFGFDRGFQWSPDGQRIAYYRFDEAAVPEFTYTDFHGELYPEYNTFKYPKVGENNSKVSVHSYDLKAAKSMEMLAVNDNEKDTWHYIPRINWTRNAQQLAVTRMNRFQNALELLLIDAKTNERSTLLKESNKYYIDITDNLYFLKDGKQFVWSSEKSGYNHLYLYDMKGKEINQLTTGNWEVTNFYGVDEAKGQIYFQAAKRDPMQREVYVKSLRGRDNPRPVAADPGTNSANFSSTYDYFVLTNSAINQPASYQVMKGDGSPVRRILDNAVLAEKQLEFGAVEADFFQFDTERGTTLNGYMMKPANAGNGREVPLLMFVYGGPGSQQVVDNWRGQNYWWFQMLVQKGFAVAVVDNRGTGGRGEEFKKMTYLELGKYETEDQISAAKYLGGQDYIDKDRIAIFGWSYGGFMALHGILQGSEVFAAAISVAPVTSWKWYDTIYTERYMRTLKENEKGYENNSPVNFADRLKGKLLLVHGMGDDNVHFQHTAEMANALIMANKQFDTYFYPNRNHGIYGGPTRLHLYSKMTNFLVDNLRPQVSRNLRDPNADKLRIQRDLPANNQPAGAGRNKSDLRNKRKKSPELKSNGG
ncbi:S9 family peptidase [Lewinellaceae bacterium SD302]|nr:S9 family peptidase [Lewinellaceae bacterium SD302]